MDPERMCRLCSFKLHKPQNIFTTPGLLDRISKFADIKIIRGDGLPCSICDLCDIKLQITDEFRHQVGKADKLIRASVLKQTAKLTESQRSETTLARNGVSKLFENGDCRPSHDLRGQPSRRSGILRERMRLTQLSHSGKAWGRNSEQSLIYSYGTARSLVASYKALINRCWTEGFREEFSLPSSLVSSDNESDERAEREARFSEARRRLQRKRRRVQKYSGGEKSPANIAGIGRNREHGVRDVIGPRVPADPLNLLKVKSVQPLVDEDGVSSADNFRGALVSRTVSWRCDDQRQGAPGRRGFGEELEDYSSSEYSSSNANSSEVFRQSDSSASSGLTIKINGQYPGGDFTLSSPISEATVVANEAELPDRRRKLTSAVQCPVCDRICANTRGLKVHFRIHRSAKCKICDAPTGTKEKFRDHMQLHINSIEPDTSFQCGVCKNIFKTNVSLNIHMRLHSKSVPAVKECPHCMRTFATLRGFKIHLSKAHSGFVTE